MKKTTGFFAICAVGPAALWACGGGTETEGDVRTDDTAVDPAPDHGGDDLEPEDGAPEDELALQGAVTFTVRNVSSGVTYLDWSYEGNIAVMGARTTGAAWEDLRYIQPSSCLLLDCQNVDPGDPNSCLPPPCGILFTVKELAAGESVSVTWDGRHVYTVDDTYCAQGCYRVGDVAAMRYKATACTYDSYECFFEEPCGPGDRGLYEPANVTGEAQCFETEFSIPYAGGEVVIEVQ